MNRRTWLLGVAGWPGAGRVASATPAASNRQALAPRTLAFPADFGAHPENRTEWWYVTGTLQAPPQNRAEDQPAGRLWGFQVTFFRSTTDVPADHPSRFAARELVFAHAALTDLAAGRLRHDQRIARAGFDIAAAAVGDTRIVLRDWHLSRQPRAAGPAGPARPAGASRYDARVKSDIAGFALELQFESTQPLLLQGDAGWSRKGPLASQASHYYSEPQLAVSGSLVQDGIRHAVAGRAWLDHEWSDTLLDPAAVGWDWIGMNLDDGGALTAFRLRRADGSTLYAGGSFRANGAAVRNFAADEVRFTPGRVWTSPASRAAYPVEWRIDTPAGRFAVSALQDDQELDSRASTGAIYWEGVSDLRDAVGRRIGRGYLELTGYAAALRL